MSGGRATDGTGARADNPRRRPYWVVGFVLFAVIAVVLGGAIALDRALRPPVGIDLSPGTAAPTPDMSAQAPALPTATNLSPFQAPRAPTSDTAGQTPEQSVEQAYLRYWDVYAAALLDLDASRLGEVAAGDELRRIQEEIAGYRRAGYAVRVRVTHDYVVVDVTASEARLADEIVDRSFRVDPVTKDPPQGSDAGKTVRDLFVLQKSDGIWKVARSVREGG